MKKLHTFIKLIIFWFLIFVLSCASGPRVKEIAKLHYGDDEDHVVETLGEGSEIFFFELDGVNYRYRFYTTVSPRLKYALLFADGRLFAVSEERPPFHECIYLIEWEECFSDAISAMKVMQLEMTEDEFSSAVTRQEETEKSGAIAVAVATPAMIIAWPIGVACGVAIGMSEVMSDGYSREREYAKNVSECKKTLDEVEDHVDLLYPAASLNHVINVLNEEDLEGFEDKYFMAAESVLDLSGGNHRIYGKSWACDIEQSTYLDVYFGFENGRMIWFSKR
jgi:hypothetical protein